MAGPITETNRTRVTATLDATIVFDETVTGAPGSAAANAALERARAALGAKGVQAASVSGPTTVSTTREVQSTQTTFVLEHVETSITTQTTFGPATILIGPNQSITFLVAPGTTNTNTNIHTENFINDVTTQTVLVTTHLQLSATTPKPPEVLPQVFQNPKAIAAIMSAVAAGNKNPPR